MGGLLVRAYIQGDRYSQRNDINKFAMVGTPNRGSEKVYYMWEGGDPYKFDSLLNPFDLYSETTEKLYEDMMHAELPKDELQKQYAIRNFYHVHVKSMRQLLSTEDFLVENGLSKEISTLWNKNTFLEELNIDTDRDRMGSSGTSTVETGVFAGIGQGTIKKIRVQLPNNLYEDGVPVNGDANPLYCDGDEDPTDCNGDNGDETVLESSALWPYSDGFAHFSRTVTATHDSLISAFSDELVQFLKGTLSGSNEVKSPKNKHGVSAITTSPLTNTISLSINGRVQPYVVDTNGQGSGIHPTNGNGENNIPNATVSIGVDAGSIYINNPLDGTYTVYLKGIYNEDYSLSIGYMDDKKTEFIDYNGFNHANTVSFAFTVNSASEEKIIINHTPLTLAGLQADAVDSGGLKTKLTWEASADPGVTGYNIYSRVDDEPYLTQIGSTTDTHYDTTHNWAENSSIKTRIYAVSAVKSDGTESFLSDMVENNDRDHDGLNDEQETALGTDVNNADTDGDGLKDGAEYVYGTNPLLTDTDGDNYSDYEEIQESSDPLDKDSIPYRLESHYTFNEGTGNIAHDSSGNGNDGAIGGATWATGKSEGGLSFDGINDYVSVPLMNNDEISICAWFYKNANDTTRSDAVFSGFRNNSNTQLREGFEFRFPSGSSNSLEFVLVTQDGSGNRTTMTARRNLLNSVGSWYHAAGTYNKTTGQQRLYVNGQLVHTVTHPAGNTGVPMTYYPNMRIGHSRVNNGYFNGVIDDVRLYNRPLSDQEIHSLYNAFSGDLQARYALDEGTGTIANDSSGNGNHGTINGGAIWATGRSGSGLSFDGVNDYITISRINNDEVSVCAWFYKNANDTTRNDAVFSGFRNNSNAQLREGFELRCPSGNPNTIQFVLVTQDGSGVKTMRTAQRNLGNSVGSWYHVTGTYNKTTGQQRLYINGQLVNTQTHPVGNTVVPLTFYSDMRVGFSRVNSGYFNGVLDDLRLYKRALSDQEVLDIYNNP